MKIAINEIFGPTIQGEGQFAGTPSVFIRLNSCNLRCCFRNSICDTPYTSHNPEKRTLSETHEVAKEVATLIDKIGGNPENSHIVITGGEPLLQQDALIDLIAQLEAENIWNKITIETNGTIKPDPRLLEATDIFWSVSPKLSTSCCFEGTKVSEAARAHHRKTRINLDALATIVMSDQDYQLKFVYSGPECITEIKELITGIKQQVLTCDNEYVRSTIDHKLSEIDSHIMLMPEGITNEQISVSAQEAVQYCIENGWKFCDRLHIRIWGDKRAV